jgi:hypothetical protein
MLHKQTNPFQSHLHLCSHNYKMSKYVIMCHNVLNNSIKKKFIELLLVFQNHWIKTQLTST